MVVTFLFWNLNRKPIESLIANLALRHEVDVLMLAECSISPGVLLTSLNQFGYSDLYQYVPNIDSHKIKIFTKFAKEFIPFKFESIRLTISHLKHPSTPNHKFGHTFSGCQTPLKPEVQCL